MGDTEHDLVGALENGAVAVGVATGETSAAELDAAAATLVLDDLADTDAVVRAVLAATGDAEPAAQQHAPGPPARAGGH